MTTLALIGSGRWGKNYIKTIRSLSSCELPNSFIKTKSYKELLSFDGIDGVVIATPASTHFQIAKEFLEKGFNVLIEKPVTTNYKDASELSRVARKYKNIVMVGHIYLYNPAFLKVKKLARDIGNIKYISSEGMNYGPIRSDVSALWDWGPHDISMAIELLESLPEEVCGYGASVLRPNTEFYDTCSLKLKFPKNIFMFISVSWLSPVKKRNMTIVGEKNTIIFDDTVEKKISLVNNLNKEIIYPSFSKASPLSEEISSFVKLIKNKKEINKSSLRMGLDVLRVIEACEKSIRLGGKILKIR